MKGHLVIHASMVPRAPAETNQVVIIKKMLEAIFEILVKEPGVLGVDEVIKALKNRNMPVDEAQILWCCCKKVCSTMSFLCVFSIGREQRHSVTWLHCTAAHHFFEI